MPLFATASGHAWGWVMECRERLSTGAQGGSTGPWGRSAASGRILSPWRVSPSFRSATIVKAR